MAGEAPLRDKVTAEAVRILRGLGFDGACETDVLLFGSQSPAASPLPLKYGVDKSQRLIYNILYESGDVNSSLFSRVRYDGGYIEFELDEAGFASLFYECERRHPVVGVPAERLVIGCNAPCIHARLLHAAACAEQTFYLPRSPLARRALWQCMMAGPPAQRSVALHTTAMALDEHRVNNTLCARTAGTMAALVLDWF